MKEYTTSMGIAAAGVIVGGLIAGGMLMSKSASYKRQYGCKSCRYERRMMLSSPCSICNHRKGTRWKKKLETCDCCGQEVPE